MLGGILISEICDTIRFQFLFSIGNTMIQNLRSKAGFRNQTPP